MSHANSVGSFLHKQFGNIVEYAQANNIDLTVMPTHGYGPFRRFILGSVTAKFLHDVNCPVWTSAHMEIAPVKRPEPLQNIVCALDLKDHSKTVLCWASRLAAAFGARLFVVHAIPEIQAVPDTTTPTGFPPRRLEHKISQLGDELHIKPHALCVGCCWGGGEGGVSAGERIERRPW